MRLADVLEDAEHGIKDQETPLGCSLFDDGIQTIVRARACSLTVAVTLFVFAAFWNSGVSVFVVVVLADTLRLIFGSLPSWFPSPPTQGQSGFASTWGGVIFMWLFLLPFIVIGMTMIGALLTILFGRVEVRVRESDGMVLTGFGPFAWRRSFDATKVTRVLVGSTSYTINQGEKQVIHVECGSARTIKLGSVLPEERLRWMAAVLRRLLMS